MMNISELLEQQIKKTKELKEKKKKDELKKEALRQKCEQERANVREREISSFLSKASKNLSKLLEDAVFQKYIAHVFKSGYVRAEHSFMGNTDKYEFIAQIASSEKSLEKTQTVIALSLPATDPFSRKIVADIKTTQLKILTHDHDFRTGCDKWWTCTHYHCKSLDTVLRALATAKSAIILLVDKFGGFETKLDDY